MEQLSNINVTIDDPDQICRENTIQQCSARVIKSEKKVELNYKKRKSSQGTKPARPYIGQYCFVSQYANGNLVLQMAWPKNSDISDVLNEVKLELNKAADVIRTYSNHK